MPPRPAAKPPAMQPVAANPWNEFISIQSSMSTGLTTSVFLVSYPTSTSPSPVVLGTGGPPYISTNSTTLIGGPGGPPGGTYGHAAEESYTGFSGSGDSKTNVLDFGNAVGLFNDGLVGWRESSGWVSKGSVTEVTGQVYYILTPYGIQLTGVSIENTSLTDESISIAAVYVQTYYVNSGSTASSQLYYPTSDDGSAIPGSRSSIVNMSVNVPNYLYAHVAISVISNGYWGRDGVVGVTIYSK